MPIGDAIGQGVVVGDEDQGQSPLFLQIHE